MELRSRIGAGMLGLGVETGNLCHVCKETTEGTTLRLTERSWLRALGHIDL